jgi:hypothetical protein
MPPRDAFSNLKTALQIPVCGIPTPVKHVTCGLMTKVNSFPILWCISTTFLRSRRRAEKIAAADQRELDTHCHDD